ncbi:Uma2 family endonuclease [Sphingomonas sp. CJ20]
MNHPFRLGAAIDPRAAFTAADFERMLNLGAFADMRAELSGGVLEKMMPALPGHGERNVTLAVRLHETMAAAPLSIGSDIAIRIDEVTVRGADIAVYPHGITANRIPEGRDIVLAVEIADTTLARDLGEKLVDYARAGVPHYWVVDAAAGVVHVMANPGPDGYADRRVIRFGDPLPVPWSDACVTID